MTGFLTSWSMVFLSVFLEGLPFLLLGSLASSIILFAVSEDSVRRRIPENKVLGVFSACLLGLVFPVCECAIVPVTARLMRKGFPPYLAASFLLSSPIINPVVLLSTHYAFTDLPGYLVFRVLSGFSIAAFIGLIIPKSVSAGSIMRGKRLEEGNSCSSEGFGGRGIVGVFSASSREFFEITRYFIIGVMAASAFQVFLPRSILYGIGGNAFFSVLAMMGFAFLISVCSNADAFIARSFLGQFTPGSLLSFMTYGAMIDLKNTLLLSSYFNRRYVAGFILLISILNLLAGVFENILFEASGVLL